MKIGQVLETYDTAYAAAYDDTFLLDSWTAASLEFQLGIIADRLRTARNWLDVACGTGYVLSRFPGVCRAGLDISQPMLDAARKRNPGATFVRRNYRDRFPEWDGTWDLVTCMWWAYCMAETMSEIRELVARLAEWTSPSGAVVLPLCNPRKFDSHNIRIPYIDPRVPGRCMITGVTWTWIEESGKRHDEVLAPQVEHMVAMFRPYFHTVRVLEGALDRIGEGWRVQDVLVAERKRAVPADLELHQPSDGARAGLREWLLGTSGGTLASLRYLSSDLRRIRLRIEQLGSDAPSAVQLNKQGYEVTRGRRYLLRFRARADAARAISCAVVDGQPPFASLGLFRELRVTPAWTTYESPFRANEGSERARIHFELGQSATAVELGDVELVPAADTGT